MPKHDSAERSIIVDLSWPAGTSVNDGISSSSYLGEDISLTYPTVDSIASLIWSVGTGCLLYKRDLKRAYIRLYISLTHPSHPDGGQRALFLRVFYRFFALLEINLSLCQTNGVSYFIGC